LLVVALDFGRVFFGWVSITNAARVGADYAAREPDAWETADGDRIDKFEDLITDNTGACTLGSIDDPVFADVTGDGDPNESGDTATVTLTCSLEFITPLASGIMGGPVTIAVDSTFPVRVGEYAGPGGGTPPEPPCSGIRIPDLDNMTVEQAEDTWVDVYQFTGSFTPNPTGQPDYIVQTQTHSPAANVGDCVDASTAVFVTAIAPPPCSAGLAQVPNMVGMLLPDARTAWAAAGFGGGFTPASSHDDKVVVTQTTGPTQVLPGGCLTTSGSVTVTYGNPPPPQCPVPNMVGDPSSVAATEWTTAGFTRQLSVQGGSGIVKTQDPGFPGTVDCDTRGTVRTN
jgi:hypothetical protein